MGKAIEHFGALVRQKRIAKGYSLRKVATIRHRVS